MVYLTEALSLEEVAEKRAQLEYYEAIIQGKLAINFQDIKSHQIQINQLLTGVLGKSQISIDLPTETYTLTSPVTFTITENALSSKLKTDLQQNL